MNEKEMNESMGLILAAEDISDEEREIIERQRRYMVVKKTDHYDSNRYWYFAIYNPKERIIPIPVRRSTLDVHFWDRTQNIPFVCILFFNDGYIEGLEVYSCDGTPFETIDLGNIEIIGIGMW